MVDLGVDQPYGAQLALANQLPGGLLRLAHEGEGRAAEPQAAGLGKIHQGVCLGRGHGQGFLAVDVLARLETAPADLEMGVVDGEVYDQLERGVRQHGFQVGIDHQSVALGERLRRFGIEVGDAHQLDTGGLHHVVGVGGRDVAATHDADTALSHGLASSSSARTGPCVGVQRVDFPVSARAASYPRSPGAALATGGRTRPCRIVPRWLRPVPR